jgi:hypothetical protein
MEDGGKSYVGLFLLFENFKIHSTVHRVGRVLFLQSSELGLPQPLTCRHTVPPPPRFWGEGHTRWRERGWGSPNSDEGTYTVVLFIQYIRTLWYSVSDCFYWLKTMFIMAFLSQESGEATKIKEEKVVSSSYVRIVQKHFVPLFLNSS